MKKKNIIVFSLIIAVALIAFVFNYINKDHRDISTEKSDVHTTSTAFFSSFTANQKEFDNQYLDKVVELSGIITTIEDNSVILDEKIVVSLKDQDATTLGNNNKIAIKGLYVCYDDHLEQLKFDQDTFTTK